MANKITKRDNFNSLLAIPEVASNPTLVAFIQHELELLDRKNKSSKSELTDTQRENIALGEEIVNFIASKGREMTVKEVREHFGVTAQKATPILTTLAKNGKLVKRVDKRVSYYSVV